MSDLPEAEDVAAHQKDTCVQVQFDSAGVTAARILATQSDARLLQLQLDLGHVAGAYAGQKKVYERYRVDVPDDPKLVENLRTMAPQVKIGTSSGMWMDRLISIAGNIK